MCRVGEWNLSGDVLISRKACAALHEYLKTDTISREEIAHELGHSPQTFVEEEPEPESDAIVDQDNIDDSDVPASAVIQQALGFTVPATDTITDVQPYCIKKTDVTGRDMGLLQGGGPREDIWELTVEDLVAQDE